MLLKQMLFAAAAAAFLVVPDFSKDKSSLASLAAAATGPLIPPELLLAQKLELPCPQCHGPDSRLKLEFAVEDGTRLTVNGFELFPQPDPWNGDVVTSVVKDHGHERKQRLGYSLRTEPVGVDKEQQLELIDVVFRVIEVGNRFVDTVPPVKLGLVRAKESGEIVVGNVQLLPPARETCTTIWCQIKSAIRHALKGASGSCSRHGGGHRHGHGHAGHKSKGHGADSYYSAKTRTRAHLLRTILFHVILPVVVGVVAGVSIAFMGIFICGVAYRAITALRRARCPRAHAAKSPLMGDVPVEKQRLIGDEEAQQSSLPEYKDEVHE